MTAFKSKSGSEVQFPGKLHDMMQFVEENGLESIIAWELNGHGIKINNPERLVEILPLFSSQTKYRSFRRQLNMWHFHRILEGPNKGIFVHPYFVRHNRDLCSQMSRHISFKPTPQMEKEYMSLASSFIEPKPIKELSSLVDMKTSPTGFAQNAQNTADFFTVSDYQQSVELPTSVRSESSLPSLPLLPGKPAKSFDETLRVIQDIIADDQFEDCGSSCQSASSWSSTCSSHQKRRGSCLRDGDLVSFAGKNFYFLESSTP